MTDDYDASEHFVIQKNWRGLDPHPVDEWDHWTYSTERYEEIKRIWDAVAHVDSEALMAFAEMISCYEACEQAERDAGDSL